MDLNKTSVIEVGRTVEESLINFEFEAGGQYFLHALRCRIEGP